MLFWIRITTALLLMCCFQMAQGQEEHVTETGLPVLNGSSLEGTSFLLGFMQNELKGTDPYVDLRLYISSRFDANVVLRGPSFPPTSITVKANTVCEVPIGSYFEVNTPHLATGRGIFVESDVPIVVYGFTSLLTTTETFTAIPINQLGMDYRVVCRGADYYSRIRDMPATSPRSGEFMVIAVEDDTPITYVPRVSTIQDQPFESITITLNAGECYLVQAQPSSVIGARDLTGSRVTSTKPFVLLSGHVRTGIPNDSLNSKDHLVEMLPPIQHWRQHYLVSPFAKVRAPYYVRVVAAEDNTNVNVNEGGSLGYTVPLDFAGSFTDIELLDPAEITASKPFLAVQLMPSNIYRDTIHKAYDPAMVVLSGLDQYVQSSILQFPKLIQQEAEVGLEPQYYFVNIIADNEAKKSLVIDQKPIQEYDGNFLTRYMPNPGFVYGSIQLPLGQHSISCDTGYFTAIMYGLSANDSYANQVGITYIRPAYKERTQPQYQLTAKCGMVRGLVRDVGVDSVQLDSVGIIVSATKNMTWQLSELLPGDSVVTIDADVTDFTKDAIIVIRTYDVLGNGREWKYVYDAPVIKYPREIFIPLFSEKNCIRVPIINADTTSTIISRIKTASGLRVFVSDTASENFLVKAKDTLWVTVCAELADSLLTDAVLIVELPCGMFERIPIRVQLIRSLETAGKDFGKVRMFDTVCSKVPVVNTGNVPITLVRILQQLLTNAFQVDTSGLQQHVVINPKDTFWITVCFVPESEGLVVRTDTIATVEGIVVMYQLLGTGIRPRILPVVIDWGPTRVGTRRDTTFAINNIGEGSAQLSILSFVGAPDHFIEPIVPSVFVAAESSTPLLNASFAPMNVGAFEDTASIGVDWKYHEPVSVILRGVGILPKLITRNIDFGSVLVGTDKDTTETVLYSVGSDSLEIYTVEKLGPDITEFTLSDEILLSKGLRPGEDLSGILQFSPTRTGSHICSVRVSNNASISTNAVDSIFVLYGTGYRNDVPRVEAKLSVPNKVVACKEVPIILTIHNPSLLPCTVTKVQIICDGIIILDQNTAIELMPDEKRILTLQHMFSIDDVGHVAYNVVASTGQVLTGNSTVLVIPTQTQLMVTTTVAGFPGSSVVLKGVATVLDTLSIPLEYSTMLVVDSDRLHVDSVQCSEYKILNSTTQVFDRAVSFTQEDHSVNISLAAPTQTPHSLEYRVYGTLLWKNSYEHELAWTIAGKPCAVPARGITILDVETCGDNLRSVMFTATVQATVAPSPSKGTIEVEFSATDATIVGVQLVGLFGQVFLQEEEIVLEKGSRHVTFTCSRIPSGVYRLLIRTEHGQQGVPVLLVN